jgi:hypothetical protein
VKQQGFEDNGHEDWSDAATSQGLLGDARFSSGASGGSTPLLTLGFQLNVTDFGFCDL